MESIDTSLTQNSLCFVQQFRSKHQGNLHELPQIICMGLAASTALTVMLATACGNVAAKASC